MKLLSKSQGLYDLPNRQFAEPIDSYITAQRIATADRPRHFEEDPLRPWVWLDLDKDRHGEAGIMLDTKPLNMIFDIAGPAWLALQRRSQQLFRRNAAMVSGSSVHSCATETCLKDFRAAMTDHRGDSPRGHGSAFDVGAVQDFVVGMLYFSPNRHICWKGSTLSSPPRSTQLQTDLVQDDDFFMQRWSASAVLASCTGDDRGGRSLSAEGYMSRLPFDAPLQQ